MSIFKKNSTNADRSATDRRRHKEKIEKAIKEGIHDIVAEESIIGQNGNEGTHYDIQVEEPEEVVPEKEDIYEEKKPPMRGGYWF